MEDNGLLGELRNRPEGEEGASQCGLLYPGPGRGEEKCFPLNIEEDRIQFLYEGEANIEDKRLKVKQKE